jgi:hypothetical protein
VSRMIRRGGVNGLGQSHSQPLPEYEVKDEHKKYLDTNKGEHRVVSVLTNGGKPVPGLVVVSRTKDDDKIYDHDVTNQYGRALLMIPAASGFFTGDQKSTVQIANMPKGHQSKPLVVATESTEWAYPMYMGVYWGKKLNLQIIPDINFIVGPTTKVAEPDIIVPPEEKEPEPKIVIPAPKDDEPVPSPGAVPSKLPPVNPKDVTPEKKTTPAAEFPWLEVLGIGAAALIIGFLVIPQLTGKGTRPVRRQTRLPGWE